MRSFASLVGEDGSPSVFDLLVTQDEVKGFKVTKVVRVAGGCFVHSNAGLLGDMQEMAPQLFAKLDGMLVSKMSEAEVTKHIRGLQRPVMPGGYTLTK